MSASTGKIPATIVTGFLGAGKTSLIQHLLKNAGGKRLALIINEFGELGVDGEIVKGCRIEGCPEENIVELANGCICCTVADDFLPTMKALIDRGLPPDHIVIETSGLALPKPLVKAFNWPEIRTRVTVDGVVAVVDGPAVAAGRFADNPAAVDAQRKQDDGLDHESPLAELFEDQINCADLIIVNKADQMSSVEHEAAQAHIIKELQRPAKMITARFGEVDPRVLLGLDAKAEDDLAARPSHHELEGEDHDHDDFESFHVDVPELSSPQELLGKLAPAIAAHDILRVKGFLAVAGKEMRLVLQGVGSRLQHYYDRPWESHEGRRGQIVVIGLKGLDRAAITAAIAA
ncbi:cobalamin biosynthesis protein CobW [Dongia mobilis]|uniref:Cobalamin biosynthesis protein CobW n=1 Tax=Dongia mobilis TaxID=578943 RepID=A0A4R6WT58_9PROT|nr:cobalamin biosynthesis protein CobW [Dongia mobilis]TDQ86409.1 cobalamin biosynthesis protein CobW [Dongia mobilis]